MGDEGERELFATMTVDAGGGLGAERRRAFGEALRMAMTSRGYTQEALADAIGVKQGAVSQWVSGTRQPPLDTTFELERLLGQRPGALTRHLGYLPLDAVKSVATVESSIVEDGTLTEPEKQMLLGAYRAAMAAKVNRKGRPRKG